MGTTVWFATWTYKHWNSRVVKASQPHFLLLACLGVAIKSLAIIPLSRESIEGRTEERIQYDRVCTSTWWFVWIGFGIIYSTLFAKTKRVNQIIMDSLRCKRIQVSLRETMYPVAIIFCFNTVMLTLMTLFGPLKYKFTDTKYDRFDRTIEKYGSCNYDDALPFLLPIGIVNFSVIGLALYQAWKARYLSTEFAESKYIGNALLISILVTIFFIPVLFLTQNDPNVGTFVNVVLVIVFSGNPLCFIFIPKIIFHVKSKVPLAKRKSIQVSSLIGRVSAPDQNMLVSATYITNNKSSAKGASTTFSRSTPETSQVTNFVGSSNPPDFVRNSSDSDEMGERILTSKPQHELASEIRMLEIENAAIRAENAELQNLLIGYTSDKDCSGKGSSRNDSSKMILEDVSYEFSNEFNNIKEYKVTVSTDDDGSKENDNLSNKSESEG